MKNMVGDISVHPGVNVPQNTLFDFGIPQLPTDHNYVDRVRHVFQDCAKKRFDKLPFAECNPRVSLPPGIGQNPVRCLHPVAVPSGNDVPDLHILQGTGV